MIIYHSTRIAIGHFEYAQQEKSGLFANVLACFFDRKLKNYITGYLFLVMFWERLCGEIWHFESDLSKKWNERMENIFKMIKWKLEEKMAHSTFI